MKTTSYYKMSSLQKQIFVSHRSRGPVKNQELSGLLFCPNAIEKNISLPLQLLVVPGTISAPVFLSYLCVLLLSVSYKNIRDAPR